mgnify:CR=1 FL=1
MAYCDSAICRRQTLLAYFEETCEPCGKCDNCLNPPQMIDGTEYAQMVLSAIYRTGQYFGSGHIVDVLRGVDSDKVKAKGHDKIKTFGVGRTATADFWKIFIRQMVSANYLLINIQRYGALQITKKGETVLKGEEEYFYRKIEFNTPIKEKRIKPETIDADTLDGLHASSFLRDDATTTFNASGNDFNIDYDNVRTLVRIQRSGTEKLRLNASSNTITVNSYNSGELRWGVNLIPSSDNSVDLGSTSNRWRNLYTNDLHLSNESRKDTGGNDVDGTWGDWTLQEGEDKIFMINNRTGKRYSIIMREEN